MKLKRLITLFAALGFALLLYKPAEASRKLLDRIVAVVNGEVIAWSELMEFIPAQMLESVETLPAEKKEMAISLIESESLDKMIEARLQLQEAKRLRLSVGDAEVDAAIDDIKAKYELNDDDLLKTLEGQKLTFERYRSNLKEQLIVSRVVNDVVKSKVVVSEEEVDERLKEEYPELVPGKSEARLRLICLKHGAERTEQEAMELADEIKKRCEAGENFDELAKLYSSDPSAESGGDLGFVRRGTILPEIEDAAFSLDAGGISDPLNIDDSVWLIMAESFKDQTSEIYARKEIIRNQLRDSGFQKQYRTWLARLKGRASIEIKLK